MGLRFHRSITILPGVKINLGLKGPSLSVGEPGATINVGRQGARSTVGLPGSGLSWTSKLRNPNTLRTVGIVAVVLGIALVKMLTHHHR